MSEDRARATGGPPAWLRLRLRLWLAAIRLRGLLYAGRSVACPVCGGRFRRFLPFGTPVRPRAECPRCHALERTRLMALWLDREEPQIRAGTPPRTIHFAPEPGLERALRRRLGTRYRTADLYWPLADDRVDLHALPYADGVFDLALVSHVLAHVADDRRALAELRRVLAPDGVLLVQTGSDGGLPETVEVPPDAPASLRAERLGDPAIFRIYGADLVARLASAGFRVERIPYAERFEEATRRRLGLVSPDAEHPGPLYRCLPTR